MLTGPKSLVVPSNSPVKVGVFRDAEDLAFAIHKALKVDLIGRFGEDKLEPFRNLTGSLRAGEHRPMDRDIVSAIATRLQECGKTSLLDVGAGSSIADPNPNANWGAPWVPRLCASTYPDTLAVTVSDLKSHGTLCIRYPERTLLMLPRVGVPPGIRHVSPSPGEVRFEPLHSHEIEKIAAGIAPENSAILMSAVNHGGEAFLIRNLENGIEGSFGIKECLSGIDLFNLPTTLEGRKYDMVIGRHLEPRISRRRDEVARNVGAVLNPGGIGLICVDCDERRGHDLCLIRPDGSLETANATGGLSGMAFTFSRIIKKAEKR